MTLEFGLEYKATSQLFVFGLQERKKANNCCCNKQYILRRESVHTVIKLVELFLQVTAVAHSQNLNQGDTWGELCSNSIARPVFHLCGRNMELTLQSNPPGLCVCTYLIGLAG